MKKRIEKIINEVIGEIAAIKNDALCPTCELYNTHCEGSRCEDQSILYYEAMERKEKLEAVYECLGKNFYQNLSIKMKLEVLK